jgi:hypothetical protein
MAPGLTWANGGSDGGDLITAAATGGVAHPTGYPVYLLLARLFQALPIGSLAFRTNLFSGLCTVAAALLVFETTKNALDSAGSQASTLGGLIAGLAFGLAPLVWSQAVITEVYALNVLLIALLVYLLTVPARRFPVSNGLIGLVQGLAVGNQILAALMIPATLISVCLKRSDPGKAAATGSGTAWNWDFKALGHACMGLAAGLLTYLILPIRAASHPAVNWGDPVTLDRFLWLVSGRLYQAELLGLDFPSAWTHLQAWAGLTLRQFGLVGLILALLGLIVFFVASRLYFLTIWIAVVYTLFAVQYLVTDSFVYLLPTYLAMSIWVGLGVGHIVHFLSLHWAYAGWMVGALCVVYLVVLGAQHWAQVDASHDSAAEMYGRQIMSTTPAHALMFAQGDPTVFTLWYFHYALHERPDLVVIANDLLPFDWYRANLQHTYPDLILPMSPQEPWLSAIRELNPGRPACYPYYGQTMLNCQ